MKHFLDYLSPEANAALSEYSDCNVGVILKTKQLPLHVRQFCVYDIGVYEKNTKFPDVVGGTSLQEYQKQQPKPTIQYAVLIHGACSDSGILKGLLKQYGDCGYLYKPFNQTEFQNNNFIKYDYSNKLVKLVEPYSFLKGGGRKL